MAMTMKWKKNCVSFLKKRKRNEKSKEFLESQKKTDQIQEKQNNKNRSIMIGHHSK